MLKWTDEMTNKLIALSATTKATREIAHALGCSVYAVKSKQSKLRRKRGALRDIAMSEDGLRVVPPLRTFLDDRVGG